MDLIPIVAAAAAAGALLLTLLFLLSFKPLKTRLLPPGPTPWPIIGNLHLLGSLPHQKFAQLAQHYGPIFFLRLGSVPTVVVSSPALAKETLATQDKTFAYRPYMQAADRVGYPGSLTFMQYGREWRDMRKLCTLELFTSKRLQEMKHVRREEIFDMLHTIQKQSRGGQLPVNLGNYMSCVSGNIVCRQLISRKVVESEMADESLREIIHKMIILFGVPVVGDFIPYMGWLDVRTKRRMDRVHKLVDKFLENVIAERGRRQSQAVHKDFLDVLLSLKENGEMQHEVIKAILLNLMAAGTETTSDTMEWIIAELIRNPLVMRKLRDEMDSVCQAKKIGDAKLLDDSDIASLTYLHAVIKEAFRLHPVTPMLVPHLSNQACELGGYEIPAKTRVLVNLWAMGRSRDVWGESCEEFRPERFLGGKNVDLRGQHFELIPFGAGRRMCAGMPLAMCVVELVVANVVRCFDLCLPGEQEAARTLDMREESGISTRKAEPLILFPKLRLAELPIP